jgi:hypothetical protein
MAMLTKPSDGRRDLNNWAREVGYDGFETYLAAGGTLEAARSDLESRMRRVMGALEYLRRYTEAPAPAQMRQPQPGCGIGADLPTALSPEMLARLQAAASGDPDPADEPVDTGNAQVQGAEHE